MEKLLIKPGENALDAISRHTLDEHHDAVTGKKKPIRLGCIPAPGYTHNPLLTLPVNMPCPCHSGKKWKKCCILVTQPYIVVEALEEFLETKSQAMRGIKCW